MFGCNTVPYKRLQRLFCHQCKYTAHAAKQRTGLYSVFSVDLTYSSAHNTVTTQADYTPPAPRWSVSQRRSISSAYQIQPPRRTLYSSAQPPYYNNVYKGGSGVPLLWIHTRQCNISQTMPARRRLAPTACESLASAAPGAPAEGSASPPVQGQPGGLQSGTGSAVRAHRLAPYTRRGSPAAGARRAARNH